MNFYRREEIEGAGQAALDRYDDAVRQLVGPGYRWPIRMRDWELWQILAAMEAAPADARVLEIGSFNTYLTAYLARRHASVTASDRLGHRRWKGFLRRFGLAPAKPTEAPFRTWRTTVRRSGASVRSLDATRLPYAAGCFDRVIALSVLEHIPAVESAVAELHRVLAPGGRMLITLDCAPEPEPYAHGVRYFSPAELDRIFAPYAVTSARNAPDFAERHWCYGRGRAIVPAFVEVTKAVSEPNCRMGRSGITAV